MEPEFACHSCHALLKQYKKKKTTLNFKPGTFFRGGLLEEVAPTDDEVAPPAADDATGS